MGCKNRPKPLPLRINKDHPYRMRKRSSPHPQRRQPLIIHTRSPEIIHTNPTDFMSLVQRLTGRNIHAQGRADPHSTVPPVATTHTHHGITGKHAEIDEVFPALPEDRLPELGSCDPSYPEGAICPNPIAARSSECDVHTPSSAAPFSATFASPRHWSLIPSPNMMFQQVLAELPSCFSSELQGVQDNLLILSP